MIKLLKKFLTLLIGSDNPSSVGLRIPLHPRPHKELTERQLIQMESEIGAQLFGDIPAGHGRQFFNLDRTTWVWYEQWSDEVTGQKQELITKYEVHPSGILKVQDSAHYTFITGTELDNFVRAVQLYYERIMRDVYQRDPASGQALSSVPATTL